MQTNDNFIFHQNKKVVDFLYKYIPTNMINIVSQYSNGFVEFGKLDDDIFRGSNFELGHVSCKIKYVHHSGLYFFNFWVIDRMDYGNNDYTIGWWVIHYMFILNIEQKKLLHDKVSFFIYGNGTNLDRCVPTNHIYPMYNPQDLKKEHFETYNITDSFIARLNIKLANLSEIDMMGNKPKKIKTKLRLFRLLMNYIQYPNHVSSDKISANSILYRLEKEEYYDTITKPFLF